MLSLFLLALLAKVPDIDLSKPPHPNQENPVIVITIPSVFLDKCDAAKKATEEGLRMATSLGMSVVLVLDGIGGNVGCGDEIAIDFINSHVPLKCLVRTHAESMNAWMFEMVPCKRVMHSNAVLKFHKPIVDLNVAIERHMSTDDVASAEAFALTVVCTPIEVATQGRITAKECEQQILDSKDGWWSFTADQALERGLVDEIIPAPPNRLFSPSPPQ